MDKYYVSGCVDNGIDIETVEDDVAEFWTLYERDEKGLSQGIVDLRFREDAEAVMAVYVERDALQEQVQKLTREREAALIECAAAKIAIQYMQAGETEFTLNTPKTDAVISEIGAKALDELAAGQRGLAEVRMRQFKAQAAQKAIAIAELLEREAARLRAAPDAEEGV